MEWISWRASHERRGWRKKQKPEAHRLQMSFSEVPASARRPGSKPDQAMAMWPTMEKLQIMRWWKDFAYSHCSWATGREVQWIPQPRLLANHDERSCSGASSKESRPLWRSMEAVETPGAWFEVAATLGDYGHTDIRESGMISSEIHKISSFQPFKLGVFFFSWFFGIFLQMIEERIGHILLVYIPQVVLFQFYFSEVVPGAAFTKVHDFQRLDKS